MKDKEKQIEICEKCKIKDNCSHRILIHMEKCKVNDCDCFQNISTDKENQITEMAEILLQSSYAWWREAPNGTTKKEYQANTLYNAGYRKLPEDSVVLSRGEYEEYQSFKNGDYCATKCDIHELSFNQMNKISDLENENEKLKKEIKNPNEVLEDRERFRARNEELKRQLENKGKETAEKFESELKAFIKVWKMSEDDAMSIAFYQALFEKIGELTKQFGVEIKE